MTVQFGTEIPGGFGSSARLRQTGAEIIGREFIKFGVVAAIGFVVDVGLLRCSIELLDTGPYLGRLVSYCAGVIVTYSINSTWTFSKSGKYSASLLRWSAVSIFTFFLNFGIYYCLVWNLDIFTVYPEAAVLISCLFSFGMNFTLARSWAFRAQGNLA
jgi:putative flippase GtrA